MRTLIKGRPPLRIIAPLSYYLCWGFIVINFTLSFGLFTFLQGTLPLKLVSNIIPLKAWAIIFLAIGVGLLYTLVRNLWREVRWMLLIALTVKALWATAFLIQSLISPQVTLAFMLWALFAYTEALTYIYFTPDIQHGSH